MGLYKIPFIFLYGDYMKNDFWIDYDKILSYNALINMIVTERGFGKSYGMAKFVTKDYLKHNNEFAYIRRYKSDLKQAVPSFFKEIIKNNEFPDVKLSGSGNSFFCNDQKFGYAMTLSTAQDLKSSNFPKVKTIIFDEFIIEEGQKKYYLHNECFVFLNLLETIMRMRNDVRVFMLGNAGNLYSVPYFLYFNIDIPYNNEYKLYKDNTILFYYATKNSQYREAKKKTRFGKLVSGTSFEDYAINNKPINDNKFFLEKKHASSKFSFAFVYNNETFGVWIDYNEGKIYVSNDYDKNTPYKFACTLSDHTPNTMMINTAKKYNCWKTFIENYKLGNVYFENNKIKNICQELFKILLTR